MTFPKTEEADMATQTLVRPVTPLRPKPAREQTSPSMRVTIEPHTTTYAVGTATPEPVVRAVRPASPKRQALAARPARPSWAAHRVSAPAPAPRSSSGGRRPSWALGSGETARPELTVAAEPSARPAKAGVRITRRGRLALLLVATVLALAVAFALQSGAPAEASLDGSSGPGAVTRSVVVGPGQTLWQIARDVRPAADPRETIARIQELNGLTTATVWAGQPLIVPA